MRFRREDFQSTQHEDGESPEWPFTYDDFAPYYARAEQVYRVHGDHTDDPTLPRDEPFPYPAIGHEPPVQEAADALRRLGYTPSNIPLGIDLRDGGGCIRCRTCDGFPCRVLAKSDADVRCVRPAVAYRLGGTADQRVRRARPHRRDRQQATGVRSGTAAPNVVVDARTVVVSCGAVNSAALLLRSANAAHPDGLANSSGMVGRNYMVHNNSIMVGINPLKKNTSEFQKTLYINDFYTTAPRTTPIRWDTCNSSASCRAR